MSATRGDFGGGQDVRMRLPKHGINVSAATAMRTSRTLWSIAFVWMAGVVVCGCGARVQPAAGSEDGGIDAQASGPLDAHVRDARSSVTTSSRRDSGATSSEGSTGSSSAHAADGATCLAGQIVCAGACVTPSSDPSNCGACGKACSGSSPYCAAGRCEDTPPSCAPGGPGMTDCGDAGDESCCTSLEVTGGTYYRMYGGANFVDAGFQFYAGGACDPAKVSSYRLDKYLVTVGRYRQFLAAWNAGWVPAPGSGKRTYLSGGQGLVDSASGAYEPGWVASDDSTVAPGQYGCGAAPTWTSAVGSQEKLPINCVNWYAAYAFCIWDGAFLPAEAEWEYAAAGGAEQRNWVWGTASPGTSSEYAIYGSSGFRVAGQSSGRRGSARNAGDAT
jgi:hypothetical protein